jgi:hypothetical protein
MRVLGREIKRDCLEVGLKSGKVGCATVQIDVLQSHVMSQIRQSSKHITGGGCNLCFVLQLNT